MKSILTPSPRAENLEQTRRSGSPWRINSSSTCCSGVSTAPAVSSSSGRSSAGSSPCCGTRRVPAPGAHWHCRGWDCMSTARGAIARHRRSGSTSTRFAARSKLSPIGRMCCSATADAVTDCAWPPRAWAGTGQRRAPGCRPWAGPFSARRPRAAAPSAQEQLPQAARGVAAAHRPGPVGYRRREMRSGAGDRRPPAPAEWPRAIPTLHLGPCAPAAHEPKQLQTLP